MSRSTVAKGAFVVAHDGGDDKTVVTRPDRNVIELRGREQGAVQGVTRYVP